jgi:hypothetical protein
MIGTPGSTGAGTLTGQQQEQQMVNHISQAGTTSYVHAHQSPCRFDLDLGTDELLLCGPVLNKSCSNMTAQYSSSGQ